MDAWGLVEGLIDLLQTFARTWMGWLTLAMIGIIVTLLAWHAAL